MRRLRASRYMGVPISPNVFLAVMGWVLVSLPPAYKRSLHMLNCESRDRARSSFKLRV